MGFPSSPPDRIALGIVDGVGDGVRLHLLDAGFGEAVGEVSDSSMPCFHRVYPSGLVPVAGLVTAALRLLPSRTTKTEGCP